MRQMTDPRATIHTTLQVQPKHPNLMLQLRVSGRFQRVNGVTLSGASIRTISTDISVPVESQFRSAEETYSSPPLSLSSLEP